MPTNRTITLPAEWAADGVELPISGSPIQGVTYVKEAITAASIEAGWPFALINESATFNEVMYRATALIRLSEQWGVLPWGPSTTYLVNARAMGSNGKIYKAIADTTGHDPVSSPTKWVDDTKEALIPPGTKMVFVQAAAPTGWTIDTTAAYNTAGLRIVTSAGGATGGSSDAFSAHTHTTPNHTHTDSFAVSGHALTVAEMPSHTHTTDAWSGLSSNGGSYTIVQSPGNGAITTSNATGSNSQHTHELTGAVLSSGAGTSGTFAPKYIDSLVCIKG